MTVALCISIRFLHPHPLYHGRADGEEPEWPPSPMRLFQALLNAASLRSRGGALPADVRDALLRIEGVRPEIVAPRARHSTSGYRLYVPHNQADLVSAAWRRGQEEASIAEHRIEKNVRPLRIDTVGDDLPALHYLYPADDEVTADPRALLRAIRPSVRAITHLGWGVDQVVGDASLLESPATLTAGERWLPSTGAGRRLRVHRRGSLDALGRRHEQFLGRISGSEWTPVAPLSAFDYVNYRRNTEAPARAWRAFRLVDPNDDTYTIPQAKLMHLAGMVRHLAIEAMMSNPPRRVRDAGRWVDQYVAGHQEAEGGSSVPHQQLSYVPLPSVGHTHTDPGIRRVLIVAPPDDEELLEHLARHLDGRQLRAEREGQLRCPVSLSRVRRDGVTDCYTRESRTWASFTPVILPGHDDRKPEKTRKLIRKALAQSGVEQRCEFEWSAHGHFAKSLSAHKYVRDGQAKDGRLPAGYARPGHLLDLSAVHLRLTFEDPVAGPLVIGAGRHYGFGLMVGVSD